MKQTMTSRDGGWSATVRIAYEAGMLAYWSNGDGFDIGHGGGAAEDTCYVG